MDQRVRNELLLEFEQKKHCKSIYEAYPGGRRQADAMYKKFRDVGIITKSWKRACGSLKTSNTTEYRKQWRSKNRDRCLAYNYIWLSKKLAISDLILKQSKHKQNNIDVIFSTDDEDTFAFSLLKKHAVDDVD